MFKIIIFAIVGFLCFLPKIAMACITGYQVDLRNILSADVVLVGKVSSYKIIGYYAQFNIDQIKVIHGSAPLSVTAMWQNSTFGLPENFDQEHEYIFALEFNDIPDNQLKERSRLKIPIPVSPTFHILQKPCSSAFIFKRYSDVGRAISLIFDGHGNEEIEANVLAKQLGLSGGSGF